ncbi:MAG: aldehyde dehydrogenase family protein [Pseudomonadota bacterium]
MREIDALIRGSGAADLKRERFAIACPASGETVALCHTATVEDAQAGMAAAAEAMSVWSQLPASNRADVLRRIGAFLDAHAATLAEVITQEQGKPLGEASGEAAFIGEEFRMAAEETARLSGEILASDDARVTRHVALGPIGVAALFPSSNYPAAIAARKVAAALAAGCACVMRAPEEAPGAAFFIAEACAKAGAPPGLVCCLSGNPQDVTAAMIADERCRIVSFTGSERVGRSVLGHAAQAIKPSIVELGGAAPVIVCADADIERAAALAAAKKHENAGQNCAAPNYILVERDAYDAFVEAYWAHCRTIRVGPGKDEGVAMGPLISARAVSAMAEREARMEAEGAEIRRCPLDLPAQGNFVAPSIAISMPADSNLLKEEIFAPLTPIASVDTLDDAIRIANDSDLGLVGYAFTSSQEKAQRIMNEVSVGSLAVNKTGVGDIDAPFGGLRRSGYGVEGGRYGVDAFLVRKYISYRHV